MRGRGRRRAAGGGGGAGGRTDARRAVRVVIVGGGFAGVMAAKKLAGRWVRRGRAGDGRVHGAAGDGRSSPRRGNDRGGRDSGRDAGGRVAIDVTLIDPKERFEMLPMLPDVLSGRLPEEAISWPLADLAGRYGFRLRAERARSIDIGRRVVVTDGGEIEFDRLIMSHGCRAEYHNVPGAAGQAPAFRCLDDVARIRETLIAGGGRETGGAGVDRGESAQNGAAVDSGAGSGRPDSGLVIVGGGYTGCEVASVLADRPRRRRDRERTEDSTGDSAAQEHAAAAAGRRRERTAPAGAWPPPDAGTASGGGAAATDTVPITVVEAAGRLMSGVPVGPEKITHATARLLRRQGVTLRMPENVSQVDPDGVVLASGERLRSSVSVWTAGVVVEQLLTDGERPPGGNAGSAAGVHAGGNAGNPGDAPAGGAVGDRARTGVRGGARGEPSSSNQPSDRHPVDEHLCVADGCYCAGDAAAVYRGEEILPMASYLAAAQGSYVAKDILRALRGRRRRAYRPVFLGFVVPLRPPHGVGRLLGVRVAGLIVHLVHNGTAVYRMPCWPARFRLSGAIVRAFVRRRTQRPV